MHARSGKSLIEILVVISLMTMILGAAGTTLHVVMRSASVGATSFALTANRARLARQFRGDAHAARSAELVASEDSGRPRLRLVQTNTSAVVYSQTPHSIVREVVESDAVQSREHYAVSKGETRFAVAETHSVELTHTATVAPAPYMAARGPRPPVLHLEATVGRDHRFLRTEPPADSNL